ncbi:hypothetical protein Cni_G03601 [Canna indica]|uniref:DUF4283 domain-containing protein n=1 Tax=Canna indica TaxID=4628 RepID=A0AAQ3JRS6_9LILI|nr:hypothetical protein Cni_G03601 [Canna indica]
MSAPPPSVRDGDGDPLPPPDPPSNPPMPPDRGASTLLSSLSRPPLSWRRSSSKAPASTPGPSWAQILRDGNFPHLAIWDVPGLASVLDLEEGFFIFRFRDAKSSSDILAAGPYFLGGSALRLIPWWPCFRPWEETFHTAPVWVRFLGLSLEFWNSDSISRMA